MMKLIGTTLKGEGHAHVNYEVMIPQAALHFPDVAKCDRFGTINVLLDHAFDKRYADCWTPQVTWRPKTGLGSTRLEAFGFIKIKFEFPIDKDEYDAWIIFPEGHPFSYGGRGIEIIAEMRIPGVLPKVVCAISLDHIPSVPRPSWFGEIYGLA